MTEEPTLIHTAQYCVKTGSEVEAWSTSRLQFEPRGWQREFKRDLRSAIVSLSAAPGQIVHGIYASTERSFVDTENILYFNVGSGAFTKAARHGLCFERSYAMPPPCPIPLAGSRLHHLHYSLRPLHTSFKNWKEGAVLARWKTRFNKVNTSSSCAYIWLGVKKGSIWVPVQSKSPPEHFGLRAILAIPKGISVRPGSVVKVIFDGVIAAFQFHDGRHLLKVSQRIAGQLGTGADEISTLLCNPEGSILGLTQLVRPFGTGVQWNPADDICLAGELITQQGPMSDKWELRGELFKIIPAS